MFSKITASMRHAPTGENMTRKVKAMAQRPAPAGGAHDPGKFAVAYLNVLIDDADQEELTAALGRIARASGGSKLVEKVELNAPSLYRTLCRRGNPELKSAVALLKAMGIRLALQPLRKGKPIQLPRARRPVNLDEEGACL
jgi:probable addiction module antidote protein